MSATLSWLLLCLLVVPSTAVWMDRPYDDNSFNQDVEYGDNATLLCSDERTANETFEPYSWTLPNLDILKAGQGIVFYTIDGISMVNVSEDGKSLHATLVTEEHFGLYHCYGFFPDDGNKEMVVKKGINYRSPYYGNLWEKYRNAVTIAGSVSAGWIAFWAIGAMVFYQVWDKNTETEVKFNLGGQDNYGYASEFNGGNQYDLKVAFPDETAINGVKDVQIEVTPSLSPSVDNTVETDTKM